jgi:hypothetical protein
MANARRRPGPKPQGPFENKRRTLTTRITEDMRAKLEVAATASGRSLSQEIELRLHESIAADGALGGPRTATIFKMLAGASLLLARDDAWLDDREKFKAVQQGLHSFLDSALDYFAPLTPDEIQRRIDEGRATVEALRQSNSQEEKERLRTRLHMLIRPQLPESVRQEFVEAINAAFTRGG